MGYLSVSVSHQTFRTLTLLLFFFFFLFFLFLFFFLFFFFLFFFFFFFSCTVSTFNILKTPTLSGHAGLFGCIGNPSNYDMDYRIFNMYMWSFCMYTHIGGGGGGGGTFVYSLIQRTFVGSAQNLAPEKSQCLRSLAHNGHPSIWWLCLIVVNVDFWESEARMIASILKQDPNTWKV